MMGKEIIVAEERGGVAGRKGWRWKAMNEGIRPRVKPRETTPIWLLTRGGDVLEKK